MASASSRFSATAVISEADEFPEDGLSSESEDGLDLSDPDAGAYTTSEGEDMDGNTNGYSDDVSEAGSSMDDLIPSEEDSLSSTEESKRYVKLSLESFYSVVNSIGTYSFTMHKVTQVRVEPGGVEDPENTDEVEEAGGVDEGVDVDKSGDVD